MTAVESLRKQDKPGKQRCCTCIFVSNYSIRIATDSEDDNPYKALVTKNTVSEKTLQVSIFSALTTIIISKCITGKANN